jgi:hypothetical protein
MWGANEDVEECGGICGGEVEGDGVEGGTVAWVLDCCGWGFILVLL